MPQAAALGDEEVDESSVIRRVIDVTAVEAVRVEVVLGLDRIGFAELGGEAAFAEDVAEFLGVPSGDFISIIDTMELRGDAGNKR